MRRSGLAAGILAGAMVLPGGAAADEAPLRVLATVGMLGDVAAEVGGDCVEVTSMMGPGSDPHLYQPTASDVTALQAAELVLYAGHGLEGQLGAVLGRFAARVPTVAVAERAAPPEELVAHDEAGSGIDPHLWMDVGLWSETIPVIAGAVSEARPACADAVAGRAADFGAVLAALDGWIAETVASIPEEARVLVTAHDAFEYFARAYGIEVVAIQGISTQSEASIADVRAAAAEVASRRVPAVFVETTINPRTIEALIAEAESLGHEVALGGALYSDAMGEAGTPEGTYVGMMRANTLAIAGALGGEAPPLPAELAPWAGAWGMAE